MEIPVKPVASASARAAYDAAFNAGYESAQRGGAARNPYHPENDQVRYDAWNAGKASHVDGPEGE